MAKSIKASLIKKELTRDTTVRFLLFCSEVMMLNRISAGPYKTLTAMCASLGIAGSAFNAYESGNSNVSVEVIARACEIHDANGHWLLTGEGPKYHLADIPARVAKIEERLTELETYLKLNENPKR